MYLNVSKGLSGTTARRPLYRRSIAIPVPRVKTLGAGTRANPLFRGLSGGLGFCANANDTACVMAEFEQSVARNAAIMTADNRIKRANCSKDWTRTPESCEQQYPDVTAAMLWAGQDPNSGGAGGAMPYNPVTPYIGPTVYTNPAQVPIYSTPAYQPPPANTPPAAVVPTATLANASRPGQAFRVGDSWQLVITGAPNAAVSATSSQNGKANAAASFGNTDAAGRKVLTGSFDAGTLGDWVENWIVGGSQANPIRFTVAAAASAPTGGGDTPAGGGGGTPGGGGGGAPSGGSSIPSSVSVLGYEVPLWLLLVGGLGGVWLMGRR